MARVWITDGSLPVFTDTVKLRASHKGLFGLKIRYEGFVDDAVARGHFEVRRDAQEDVLFAEAEWYLEFVQPIGTLLQDESTVGPGTEVVLQGFIEGKWMNRLLGTTAWKPASMGNNVVGEGPGITTTLDALERGVEGTTTRLDYVAANGLRCTHATDATDLRGHNITDLVREVMRVSRETGASIDGIDLGAVGDAAAVVNEKERLRRAIRMDAVPLPNPLNFAPHRAKERLVRQALQDQLGVSRGTDVTLTTTGSDGEVVGRAVLALADG